MTSVPRLAWLFDVDGTLLLTGGAAREAFSLAVRDVIGPTDELRDIAFAGRIEPQILADILAKHEVVMDGAMEARFWDAVLRNMATVFPPGRGWLLAGVPELLDAVGREPAWVSTLLTGNMTGMARIKLDHFGITHRFVMGAYGEEAANRDELACLAVRRIGERFGVPPSRCVVVGDTIHDVRCARAAGARAIAVATGSNTLEELVTEAPDLALPDLEGLDELLSWAKAVAAGD